MVKRRDGRRVYRNSDQRLPEVTFDDPDITYPRLIALNIQVKGFRIRMVNVYSPTNCDDSDNLKDFSTEC